MINARMMRSHTSSRMLTDSKMQVTWVEHSEYGESAVHLYRHILNSGTGFGAQRWIAALQRHYECMTILLSPTILGEDQTGLGMLLHLFILSRNIVSFSELLYYHATVINLGGKKSMLKLARRMVDSFCSGVCASTLHNWGNLVVESVSEDVRILTRKIINEPGEPDGIVLSVSTSIWLPVSQ